MDGRVLQLNVKPGTPGEHGLPKRPVEGARVTRAGMEGDFNRYRHEKRGDDPDMAILLMPVEMIEEIARDGWPVRPGDLGENVTTQGIPYASLAPGTRVRIGEQVELEVSKACKPCRNLHALPYVGEARGPDFIGTTLNRRGWYARVLAEGTLRRGDPVRVLRSTPGPPP